MRTGISYSILIPYGWEQALYAGCGGCRVTQPNPNCPETTTATSDLLCTYVEKCMGGSCPDWNHPGCPEGMVPIDVGYDSDPRVENLGGDLVLFTDSGGNSVTMTKAEAEQLMALYSYYKPAIGNLLMHFNTGQRANSISWFSALGGFFNAIYSPFPVNLFHTEDVRFLPQNLSCWQVQHQTQDFLLRIEALCIPENEEGNGIPRWHYIPTQSPLGGHNWIEAYATLNDYDWSIRFDAWKANGPEIFIEFHNRYKPNATSQFGVFVKIHEV